MDGWRYKNKMFKSDNYGGRKKNKTHEVCIVENEKIRLAIKRIFTLTHTKKKQAKISQERNSIEHHRFAVVYDAY